jgi:molybdate transport system substrate-binding protein
MPGDISVLSTLALKGVLEATAPQARIRFDSTQALLKSIAAGESADVVILTAEAIDDLAREGKVVAATKIDLGSSGVGLAVRAGAPKPHIGTVEALKNALLAAKSVAHSRVGASGIYFAELLKRLQIAPKRVVIVEKGPVGAVVAAGGAEIGVQQLCELAPVAGIDIVGPLPPELQKLTFFSAAVMKASSRSGEAKAFLDFLRSAPVREAMRKNLFQP